MLSNGYLFLEAHIYANNFFSKMNITKSHYRSRLTDENLSMQLRVATLSVRPNIKRLVKKILQYFLLFHASILCSKTSAVWFAWVFITFVCCLFLLMNNFFHFQQVS